jgi:hypothetical protein
MMFAMEVEDNSAASAERSHVPIFTYKKDIFDFIFETLLSMYLAK